MASDAVTEATTRTVRFGDRLAWRRSLGLALAAGLLLGVLGPFGSYLNPRPAVLAYWTGTLLLGSLVFCAASILALRMAPRLPVPPAARLAAATVAAAVPVSLACHAVAIRLWPGPIGGITWWIWYGQTLLISAPLAALTWVWVWGRAAAPEDKDEAAALPVSETDFLTLLPRHLGRDLVALQMEDHYVRAYTRQGSALILIPLRQALAGLSAVPGLQVHRSWWVAHNAVTGTVQDGRNLRLRLINGLEAPVARTRVAAVKAEGFSP